MCGAVRYRVTAPPLSVYACHCRDCQRLASGPYAIGLIVLQSAFFASGPTIESGRLADSGRTVAQFSCSDCGCRIWNVPPRTPHERIVRAGTLDDPTWAEPAVHIWTRSRLPWVELGDAPQYLTSIPSRELLFQAWNRSLA